MLLPPPAITARPPWVLPLRLTALWTEVLRLIKYGLVGLTNSVVSFGVLNLFFFLWAPHSSAILVLGSTTAYAAGDLNSYWWNGRWTFGAGKPCWRTFAKFAAVSIACMGLNAAILWLSAGWMLTLGLPPWLVGNATQISGMLAGSLGYLACRFWIFRPHCRE